MGLPRDRPPELLPAIKEMGVSVGEGSHIYYLRIISIYWMNTLVLAFERASLITLLPAISSVTS